MARLRGNFTFTTFTTAKVGPKGDPIFDDVVTWRRGDVAAWRRGNGGKLCWRWWWLCLQSNFPTDGVAGRGHAALPRGWVFEPLCALFFEVMVVKPVERRKVPHVVRGRVLRRDRYCLQIVNFYFRRCSYPKTQWNAHNFSLTGSFNVIASLFECFSRGSVE